MNKQHQRSTRSKRRIQQFRWGFLVVALILAAVCVLVVAAGPHRNSNSNVKNSNNWKHSFTKKRDSNIHHKQQQQQQQQQLHNHHSEDTILSSEHESTTSESEASSSSVPNAPSKLQSNKVHKDICPSHQPSTAPTSSRRPKTALFDEFPTEDIPASLDATNAQTADTNSGSSSSSSSTTTNTPSESDSDSAYSASGSNGNGNGNGSGSSSGAEEFFEDDGSSSSSSGGSSSDELEGLLVDDEGYDSNSDAEIEEQDNHTFAEPPGIKRSTQLQLKALKEKRRQFLDHIALISTSFLKKESNAKVMASTSSSSNDEEETTDVTEADNDDAITPQTDLTLPGRHFHIVTTAALPWMTGTAVNPLLRAAYLHRRTQRINNPTVDVDMVFMDNNNDTTAVQKTTYSTSSSSSQQRNSNASTTNKKCKQWVTLVIPWLELEEDQLELYGQVFEHQEAQEEFIRDWLANSAGMTDVADPNTGLKILFYPARYHSGLRSIFAMGDICRMIPDTEADVCVLEEPEHCNWYRAPGDGWTQKFHYVVGIVHTNYKEYASAHYSGLWTAPAIALVSSAMVRAYCHQVIKLSDVLQTFATEKEATSNVHGVRADFLDIGIQKARELQEAKRQKELAGEQHDDVDYHSPPADNTNTTTVYFIGKLLWAKGLDLLMDLQDYYKQCTGHYFAIDIYGSGPEQKAIRRAYWGRKLHSKNNSTHAYHQHQHQHQHHKHTTKQHYKHRRRHKRRQRELTNTTKIFTSRAAFKEHLKKFKESLPSADNWRNFKETIQSTEIPTNLAEFRKQPIPATFPGRVDHASLGEHAHYKIFVNPSVSEVLCTTTAEALAMGKFAIIPVHPSNKFFLKFPNCLAYRNKFEFAANLQWALTHDPEPLTPELAHEFTWEAATDRFIEAAAVTWKEAREREKMGYSKRDERIAWFHNELGKGPKGDLLRMVLGGGPASAQVKYVLEQESKLMAEGEEEEVEEGKGGLLEDMEDEDEDVEQDEGLSSKFRRSSFVQALHATVANGLPSTMGGWDRDNH